MENTSEFWKTETSGKSNKEMENRPEHNSPEYTVINSITENQKTSGTSYPIGTYDPGNGYPPHVVTDQSPFSDSKSENVCCHEINICTNCNFYQTQKTKIAVIS